MDITLLKDALGEALYGEAEEKLGRVDNLRIIDTQEGNWIPRSRFDEERRGLGESLKGAKEELEALRGEHEAYVGRAEKEGRSLRDQLSALRGDVRQRDEAIEGLTASLTDRDGRLEALRGDMEKSEGRIRELEASLASRDREVRDLRVTGKAREALRRAGARDPDLVLRLMDMEKVREAGNGELEGLGDQLDAIRRDAGYLFQRAHASRGGYAEEAAPTQAAPAGGGDINAAIRAAFGRR